jgi:hypothetical protein
MTHDPYTYITLSLDQGTEPRMSVSFHTAALSVVAGVTDKQRPYLFLSSREASVHLSTVGGGPVTDADLAVARELSSAATRYLAECERLHTAQSARASAGGTAA